MMKMMKKKEIEKGKERKRSGKHQTDRDRENANTLVDEGEVRPFSTEKKRQHFKKKKRPSHFVE